ncbi:MAG: NifB/NifX family molybdenum-iron cluster-binding protein [Gammaproteobacteria bacterium]|nr:NifB/NifX family molybdenum-iron cluster-binding protein [Gammaproteobacteria bacterium]
MIIAIPVDNNKLDLHFGHCKKFALITIDSENKKILSRKDTDAPPHQPGLLPAWLAEQGVNMVIAGGMGQRAKELLDSNNIKVVVGAPQESPEILIESYLKGVLELGENCCDH